MSSHSYKHEVEGHHEIMNLFLIGVILRKASHSKQKTKMKWWEIG